MNIGALPPIRLKQRLACVYVAGLSAGGAAAVIMGQPIPISTQPSGCIRASPVVPPATFPPPSQPCDKAQPERDAGPYTGRWPEKPAGPSQPLCSTPIGTRRCTPATESMSWCKPVRPPATCGPRWNTARYRMADAGSRAPSMQTIVGRRCWSSGSYMEVATPGPAAVPGGPAQTRGGPMRRERCCGSFSIIRTRWSY
jgi:hypothetical protein